MAGGDVGSVQCSILDLWLRDPELLLLVSEQQLEPFLTIGLTVFANLQVESGAFLELQLICNLQ